MKKLAYLIIILFLASCAQVGSLSGGDKDTTPPKLVKSTPNNGDTLYTKTRIELTFNEYVELNNITQQLVISPLVKPLPKAEIHGKTVVLTFDTLLRENTTYTLFFGEGIRDYTEKNVWTENMFVFSTGPKLDSLQISGSVKNSTTLLGENNMIVMLYKELEDSAVSKKLPSYFAKTDKNGAFKISHVHDGNYRIFALQDMNGNYLFDLPNEKIAYKSEPIAMQQNIDNIVLSSFLEKNEKQEISTKQYLNEQGYSIAFKKKTKNLNITVPSEKLHHISKFNNGDSAVIWFNPLLESEMISIVLSDVDFTDTIVFNAKEAKQLHSAKLKTALPRKKLEVLPNDSLKINFNFPLKSIDEKNIVLKKDSTFLPAEISINNYQLIVKSNAEESANATLKIAAGAITDIYGKSNIDSISIPLSLLTESNVGELLLKVDIKEMQGPFVLQVLSTKGEIVKEEHFNKNTISFQYNNLLAENYQIKLLIDRNDNKMWDSGNYYKHQQPEQIIFYEKPLTVRGNWEMEIQWNVIGK